MHIREYTDKWIESDHYVEDSDIECYEQMFAAYERGHPEDISRLRADGSFEQFRIDWIGAARENISPTVKELKELAVLNKERAEAIAEDPVTAATLGIAADSAKMQELKKEEEELQKKAQELAAEIAATDQALSLESPKSL